MKRNVLFKQAVVIMLLLACSLPALAAKVKSEKRREINKEYNVSDKTRIDIDNSFGLVTVEGWDQNRVVVQIEIKIEASSDKKAEDILERVDVEIADSNPAQLLSFRTTIKGRTENYGGSKARFWVNYTVKMPSGNQLELENRHGETVLGDLSGDLELESRHGDVRAGNLSGDVEIDISFGSLYAQSLDGGELTLRHSSDSDIKQVGDIEVDLQHGDLTIEKGGEIDLMLRHGEVEIEEARSVTGNTQHGSLEIDKVANEVRLNSQHGVVEIKELEEGFSLIDLDMQFVQADLGIVRGTSFVFDGQTSFGNIDLASGMDMSYKNKEMHSKHYKGTVGSKDTSAEIRLRNQHGSMSLRWR